MSNDPDFNEDDLPDLRIDRPHDDHGTAQIAHWGGFLTGVLLPLILYVVQQDKKSFAAWHARESLNFQISLMLYYGLGCVPFCLFFIDESFIFVGLGIMVLLAIFELACVVLASLAVSRGERYRYPLTISFVPRPSADRNHYDHRE